MEGLRYALLTIILAGLLSGAALARAAPSLAANGACPVWKAERDVKAAKKAVARAEQRLAEAKRVLSATKTYTAQYGASVGRWIRLARRSGYCWPEIPTFARVCDRESDGAPSVPNESGSGALGMMQVMPEWADGSKVDYWKQYGLPAKWDRTDPLATLRHTSRMAWSNWGE